MTLDSKRAAALGRIGAHRLHALHDSREVTAPARQAAETALNTGLLAEIDAAAPGLPEPERQKRLQHARRAYFQALSLRRWGK